ncbi:MAG: hypothetical protein GY750_08365 [Lentisphaerae bacterium]|nr:hypothetical protein [Lentisphaerota bacterium]MCP4101423.1 hypothetical protein [Lentisphaerota bacterium]
MNIGIFTKGCDCHQAALWTLLDKTPDINVKVFSFRDCSDEKNETEKPKSQKWRIGKCKTLTSDDLSGNLSNYFFNREALDVVLVNGCRSKLERKIIKCADKAGCKIIFRGILPDDPMQE